MAASRAWSESSPKSVRSRCENQCKTLHTMRETLGKQRTSEHLRILKACNKLVKPFRMRLGNAFLQDVHTVCAHPVKTNLFVKTNRYNHLPNTFGR